MRRTALALAILLILSATVLSQEQSSVFGFRNPTVQLQWEKKFMEVPDPRLAEQHLRILTSAPHFASTPEDKKTAEYVAHKFREAGLDTQIVEYRVWMNFPAEISVDVVAPSNVKMHGPTREHVEGDPYQDDPRVLTAFNAYSPSGDVEADVVYANYGRPEDIRKLKELGIDVRGKILLVRYGQNFRGVKSLVAQEAGAAGVIIYSDPSNDGWFRGDKYPKGPWRPDTAVQRGSINYMFEVPGDPTTPGFASLPELPESKRVPPQQSASMPKIPTTPLSYHDAQPILEHLGGPPSPRDWQGALPFTYHVGPGPVRVKMHLKQNYSYRTIWNVIGIVRGSEFPAEWVVAGNHRDAWVYGAVDPNSGTTVMLEAVHGIGELMKAGWRPRRTVVFASWDGEEQGLVGSTEWGEQHESELANAAAYFNVDVAVAGPNFDAAAVPSLKQFVRDVTMAVPDPKGGTVYEAWRNGSAGIQPNQGVVPRLAGAPLHKPAAEPKGNTSVDNMGSGSDYTVFLQHLGVPSTDVESGGPYGVYHSVFDNFAWYKKFADPDFLYAQEMARIFGLEVLRMASADVLPYSYETYGREIVGYLESTRRKSETAFGSQSPSFSTAEAAARHLIKAGEKIAEAQKNNKSDIPRLNQVLIQAERGFLLPKGLPNRPWYRHAIYAPGEYTGYAAVVLPAVNDAIDKGDVAQTAQQIQELTNALNRVADILESYR